MENPAALEFQHLVPLDDDPLVDVDDEPRAQFQAIEKLAAVGVHSPAFQREVAQRDAEFQKRFEIAEKNGLWKTPAEVTPAGDDTLEKAFRPEGRRRANLREFLKARLAEGDNVRDIISHARRYDERTALLLEEVAAEF
jgi:hypothetical protein